MDGKQATKLGAQRDRLRGWQPPKTAMGSREWQARLRKIQMLTVALEPVQLT